MASSITPQRFWGTSFFVLVLFSLILYQLFQLSVIRREAFMQLADRQHQLKIDIPPLRGQILDRHGKELATNLKVPSVYAVPRVIADEDKADLAAKVSVILGLDKKFVAERLARDKAFVWLKRQASYEEAEQIRRIESPGLGVVKEYKRFYPQGDLLAHVLGFTNIDHQGLEGIELALNHELRGREGRRVTKRDALGREIKAFEIEQTPAIDGHRVTLTIDQYIQFLTERALDKAYTDWKALGAMAIVMEVKTGRILAIANRPKFDPNKAGMTLPANRRDRAITDMYEPGSVFKIVAASAALNEGKATPESTFNCENGAYRYGGGRILHDVHPYGTLSFEDVIVKSSNIGSVKIASRLGPELFQSYVEAFGFGKLTGIDLPGEAPGYTRPVKEWSKTSPYNIPIGQEILVTPLQMVTAMSVIANGGYLVKPYAVERIEDQSGVLLREKAPVIKRQVIKPETAAIMRHILVRVVEEGTGKKAMIPGIPVGGKTGTAQKLLPNRRGYSHSNFMSSFVGFAPADDPQFAMIVVVDDPKPLYYGGVVAAPVFQEVMQIALLSGGYVPHNAKRISGDENASQALPENRPKMLPAATMAARI